MVGRKQPDCWIACRCDLFLCMPYLASGGSHSSGNRWVGEAENSAGDSFGELIFTEIAQHLDLDGILDHLARFQAPNEAQDDCTLVEVCYGRGSSLSPRKTAQ